MIAVLLASLVSTSPAVPQEDPKPDEEPSALETAVFGLSFRALGPALMSGRIADIEVHPRDRAVRYVAAASGGVWKTRDAGATWTPIFDDQGSFSIGCIALDPQNPHTVWVGTGENNSQRSVSWGDGVYRSRDGGASWENMGLKESEHIGRIVIDPRDSRRVLVAAQGPLWRSGGERGLYRTSDGGQTWERVLFVDDDTGANEVWADPRDPDLLYASTWQRRRRQWTLLDGGPGSGLWKSTDGGDTWRKLESGIPSVDKGRIGLAVSPADPDVVYAIIEAARGEGGVFRSTDRGETWTRRSETMTSSPQYYNELVADPSDRDRVYLLDTFLQVSTDGGATFRAVANTDRHVDDHDLWIEPENPRHFLVGCDGGLYESFDRGEHWVFSANLPITQFYRVAVDQAEPFYHVYGGTQDNNTLGGPVRTTDRVGIANEHWFVTVGGDGFEPAVDPTDPDIVYSQWQYGNLVRHDRRSGENTDIKPRGGIDDPPLRWNWDSPLLISPHDPARLYFGGSVVFRSDDRGDSWTAITGDVSRGLDRNHLEMMGTVWSLDAVARNHATSPYGTAVALSESPLVEGLLYVGTDDGLVHVSADGGGSWTTYETFPGVPERTYVSCLVASRHDADTVYATFDAHKSGDFSPYVLVSHDRGARWDSVVGPGLEAPHVAWSLAEDTQRSDILFLGTEFGLLVTLDGGESWIPMKGGLPTIAVRDVTVQRREDDLVLATFGRGFYVLDDLSPLRQLSPERLEQPGALFDVRPALAYHPRSRLGGGNGRGSQGASFWSADNPPFGAVFTYHLAEKLLTAREARWKHEDELREAGQPMPQPSWDDVRAEDDEHEPEVWLVVRDEDGSVVRRVRASREKGLHRVAWDLREPAATPVHLAAVERPEWAPPEQGPLVAGGTYQVSLESRAGGKTEVLDGPRSFEVVPLGLARLPAPDRAAALAFQHKLQRLQRAVRGAIEARAEAADRVAHLVAALAATPAADPAEGARLAELDARLKALQRRLEGDHSLVSRDEPAPPSIRGLVQAAVSSEWFTSSAPTATDRASYDEAGRAFALALAELRAIWERDLPAVEADLEAAGAPYTPGRLPEWTME